MTDLNFHFHEHHTRVDVTTGLLSAGRLSVCLLQLPPSIPQALADASRPVAVNALRDLLAGGPEHPEPALHSMAPGGGPILIVAPEFALGSPDWATVDAFVRAVNRPMVLVAGFGATVGQAVLDWVSAEEGSETERHLSWRQDVKPISPVMRVNGGWCWVHDPDGTTHCIAYLKNVLEQGLEAVVLDDLQTGEEILHLRFADLDLFPLICADLIQPAVQNAGSPQARIRQALHGVPSERPALVVGSLLQPGFNLNWPIAIDSVLNTVLAGRPAAVALCNVAHDSATADENADKWRSLSGVFAPFGALPKGQSSLPAARSLNGQGLVGAVVRQTHPSATVGLVSWSPYNPVAGLFVWRGNMYCPISENGLVAPISPAPNPAACELSRFLRRHPPDGGAAPRLTQGIALIHTQIAGGGPPTGAMMLDSTLNGVGGNRPVDPDMLHEPEVASALKAGLHALATVKSIDGVEWQANSEAIGQVRIDAQERNVLVWRSATDSPLAMKRKLGAWLLEGGDHSDLVVLGSTRMGDLSDGEIEADRRDDITVAPGSDVDLSAGGSLGPLSGDFTSARPRRRVAALGLSRVAEVYAEYDSAEDGARVAALLGRIGAFFQEGAP